MESTHFSEVFVVRRKIKTKRRELPHTAHDFYTEIAKAAVF